jgi:O-antigen ligase
MMLCCAELALVRRRVAIKLPLLLLLGMAVFTVGGVISSFGSYSAFKSVAIVLRLILQTVFWFWLGTVVLTRREHIQRAVGLWVASAALCGTAAIAQVLAGPTVIPHTIAIYGRSTGFTNQPNDLGGICAIAFIPALMLFARPGRLGLRRVRACLLLLCVAAGLLLSGSVGALIAAGAATVTWFAFRRISGRSATAFAVLLAAVVATTGVQIARGVPTPIDRFHRVTATSGNDTNGAGSLDSRIATYRVAGRAIRRNPFVGVGLDLVSVTRPFGVVSYQYDVHNLLIGTWYKAGLLGIVGMLISVVAVAVGGRRAVDRSKSELDAMVAAALLSAFVGFVVFAMGAPVLFSRYGWIPAALLLAARAVHGSDQPVRAPAA